MPATSSLSWSYVYLKCVWLVKDSFTKGVVMKFVVAAAVALSLVGITRADELSIPDNTKSVLVSQVVNVQPTALPVSSTTLATPRVITVAQPIMPTYGSASSVTYKNRKRIAPGAALSAAGVNLTRTELDACCQKVTNASTAYVAICAPACPTKQDVRTTRNGGRVVYDYGRYEAVVTDKKDGNVEVKYRKRLLDR